MLRIRALLICAASLFFVETGCNSSPTAPVASQGNYAPLQTGMVKQYYDSTDNYYQNNKIYGTATREDGQKVYVEYISTSSRITNSIFQTYYFIRDGYYYASSLVKTGDSANPYQEVKIGKVHPQDGDTWTINYDQPDSSQLNITAKYVGDFSTPAGVFNNVYDFQYQDNLNNQLVHLYYAENIGHIATIEGNLKFLLNYAKIGDKEYGVQQPYAVLPKTKSSNVEEIKFPYLGFF